MQRRSVRISERRGVRPCCDCRHSEHCWLHVAERYRTAWHDYVTRHHSGLQYADLGVSSGTTDFGLADQPDPDDRTRTLRRGHHRAGLTVCRFGDRRQPDVCGGGRVSWSDTVYLKWARIEADPVAVAAWQLVAGFRCGRRRLTVFRRPLASLAVAMAHDRGDRVLRPCWLGTVLLSVVHHRAAAAGNNRVARRPHRTGDRHRGLGVRAGRAADDPRLYRLRADPFGGRRVLIAPADRWVARVKPNT